MLLAKSLLFQVDEVFLIHNETGLLLQHVQRGTQGHDGDLVSGMLTAIGDFVRDSFELDDGESLSHFKVGDVTVLVERGPHAALAAVVRGQAPAALRTMLQETLEAVHAECHHALSHFEGDDAPFSTIRPLLQACLIRELKSGAEEEPRGGLRRWLIPAILGTAALAVAALWVRSAWGAHKTDTRLDAFLAACEGHPGIEVLGRHRSGSAWQVRLAEDPEIRDKYKTLAARHLTSSDNVKIRALPFHMPYAPYVLARARRALQVPQGVDIDFSGSVLRIAGFADDAWRASLPTRLLALPEVRATDLGDLVSPTLAPLLDAQSLIERRGVTFAPGTEHITPHAELMIKEIATQLDALAVAARELDTTVQVDVRGASDTWRRNDAQADLDRRRADAVRARPRHTRQGAHGPIDGRTGGPGGDPPIRPGSHHRSCSPCGIRRTISHRRDSGRAAGLEPRRGAAMIQKKICMVGSFAVGKSSLVSRFVPGQVQRGLSNHGRCEDRPQGTHGR